MKNKNIFLSIIIVATLLFSIKFTSANSDSTKVFFQQAFNEAENMLEGKQKMDFERAVFITENPYLNNQISYAEYQQVLNLHTYMIKRLMAANNREASMDFRTLIDFNTPRFDVSTLRYTETEKKEMYRKTLANWSIFTYMTDTTFFYDLEHIPFSYQINDPFGMNDWKNSQVINLLLNNEQKGNCFAITSLFKIFSDRLNSGSYICIAPQHIYIQHQDHKGDFYNVELATGTYPGDGSLQTLTYTHREAILSGIALRRLEERQNIALCLVNLGKSYEHKFKTKDDDFILQCAELALNHDSLSLNAMLLKEQVLEEKVIKYATQKNITDINKLKLDKGIAATYKKLETQIIKLHDLGYYQMPRYMQEMILAGLQRKGDEKIIVQDRTPNPFTSIKVDEQDRRYSTLSGGLFEEVHEKKQFEQYGRFTIDTDKKKIIKLESENNFQFLIDPVVFAWNIDPLAHEFPSWSPYAAFAGNPILFTDPDGKAVRAANKDALLLMNALFSTFDTKIDGKAATGAELFGIKTSPQDPATFRSIGTTDQFQDLLNRSTLTKDQKTQATALFKVLSASDIVKVGIIDEASQLAKNSTSSVNNNEIKFKTANAQATSLIDATLRGNKNNVGIRSTLLEQTTSGKLGENEAFGFFRNTSIEGSMLGGVKGLLLVNDNGTFNGNFTFDAGSGDNTRSFNTARDAIGESLIEFSKSKEFKKFE